MILLLLQFNNTFWLYKTMNKHTVKSHGTGILFKAIFFIKFEKNPGNLILHKLIAVGKKINGRH